MNEVTSTIFFKTLTIERLTACANAEHEVLKQGIMKVVIDHYEEVHHNQFCQFMHDGATLKNKEKHHAMGMQFADKDGKHNNVIALGFRKPNVDHKAGNVANLAKELMLDFFGCEFIDLISSSVQDLVASSDTNNFHVDELNVACTKAIRLERVLLGNSFVLVIR